MDDIVNGFLTFRNQIKLYHWRTSLNPRHMASDKFLELFDEKTDKFVEAMSGGRDIKPNDGFSIKFNKLNDKNIFEYVINFKEWLLVKLPTYLFDFETDLLNLRDEIVCDLNQMLYLFRLK